MRKILPSITSIGLSGSTWRDKIRELKELNIKEVALFVTGLTVAERHECFSELQKTLKTHQFAIPFCHAVSSMDESDYHFLKDVFGTKRFNLHPLQHHPLQYPLSDNLRECIYIENSGSNGMLFKEDVSGFAGVCLDMAHLVDLKISIPEKYPQMIQFLQTVTIGANHLSGILSEPFLNQDGMKQASTHVASAVSQYQYLQSYPIEYFSNFCAIELENPLSEQIVYKAKIEAMLTDLESLKKAA